MKPDYDIIKSAIQLAIDSDSANRAKYARAKWELDRILTHRMSVMESLKDILDRSCNLYYRIRQGEVSDCLDSMLIHLERAIETQHEYENRKDDYEITEYFDNKRKEKGERQ